jgi:hypothetical protein
MLRRLVFSAVLVIGISLSIGSSAETRLLEVPSRYLVVPLSAGDTRHLHEGDAVLDVPLRWRSAAVLTQTVEVAADDRRATLREGQSLAETRLQFDDPKFAQAAAFCVPRVADPLRKNPLLGMGVIGSMLARSTTDSQFCVIDANRDGLVDYSVLINAGSTVARTPVAINPIPYKLEPGAAVGEGDTFKIIYGGGYYFEMAIIQQGHARRFDTLTFGGPSGKDRYRKILRVVKMPDGSVQVAAPGVVFNAKNLDKASKSIDVEWPAVTRLIALPIPDVVRESNGFSY